VEYRGWKVERCAGRQVGHRTEGGGLLKRLGIGTSRACRGWEAFYPDGGSKFFDTVKEAKAYIDRWHDGG
jgi:hypothetical protein